MLPWPIIFNNVYTPRAWNSRVYCSKRGPGSMLYLFITSYSVLQMAKTRLPFGAYGGYCVYVSHCRAFSFSLAIKRNWWRLFSVSSRPICLSFVLWLTGHTYSEASISCTEQRRYSLKCSFIYSSSHWGDVWLLRKGKSWPNVPLKLAYIYKNLYLTFI